MTKRRVERDAVFQPEFRDDLRSWVAADRRVAMRVLELVEAIMQDPFRGIGKPEPLRHLAPNTWSRRITQEHRLVYLVRSDRVSVTNPLAIIERHFPELRALGARRIGVFGSFARGDARDDSDVDVYVEFEDDKRTYDNFFALHERLETLLNRRVDLVTDKALNDTKARLILPTVRYASAHARAAARHAPRSGVSASRGGPDHARGVSPRRNAEARVRAPRRGHGRNYEARLSG